MGIGKRELMEDYYMDEIGPVIEAWNELHDPERARKESQVEPMAFFGDGGEWLEA